MSKENSIKLRAGDSALIVRHEEQGGFTIEIYHHMDKNILTQVTWNLCLIMVKKVLMKQLNKK
jgi:hypothetical protein